MAKIKKEARVGLSTVQDHEERIEALEAVVFAHPAPPEPPDEMTVSPPEGVEVNKEAPGKKRNGKKKDE
jgi:hypothetical protein